METKLGKFISEHAWQMDGDYDFDDSGIFQDRDVGHYLKDTVHLSLLALPPLVRTSFLDDEFVVLFTGKLFLLCRIVLENHPTHSNPDEQIERGYPVVGMMIKQKPLLSFLGKDSYEVQAVSVREKYRNQGVAKLLYKLLTTNLKYTLVGDVEQYDGARNVWMRLSHDKDFIVSVVDTSTKKTVLDPIIITDIKDRRIWDDPDENPDSYIGKNYRLVLKAKTRLS